MFFSGICLLTRDVRRLSDFYQRVLHTSSDCDDEIHQEIRTDGACLAILKCEEGGGGNPNMSMAFTVGDVDREYLRLRELGVEILDEPADRPWGTRNMRFCDPDGNYIVFRSFPERVIS